MQSQSGTAFLIFIDKEGCEHLEAAVDVLAMCAHVAAAATLPLHTELLAECAGCAVGDFLKQYYETSAGWYKTTADGLHKEEPGPACCGWKLCSAFLPSVCPQSTEHVKEPHLHPYNAPTCEKYQF